MCNTWGCVRFPYVIETRSSGVTFSRELDEWLRERNLRMADVYGKGDFLHILKPMRENYAYAFKDPDVAMMFKLTWG